MNETIIYIVQGAVLILVIISIVLLTINNKKVRKYKEMYDKALAKFNNADIPNAEFNIIYERLNRLEDKDVKINKELEIINEKDLKNLKKIGFVKYNAYEEGDSKLSFALALTDEKFNGIMLNKIYSKHGSNIYAKEIKEGVVDERISEQEKTALDQIKNGQKIVKEYAKKPNKEKSNGRIKKY